MTYTLALNVVLIEPFTRLRSETEEIVVPLPFFRQVGSANRRGSGAQERLSRIGADFASGVEMNLIIPFRKAPDLTRKTHLFALT